ncbi:MAG TPA: hypothetical protein VI729_00615 [Anaerolineales bacterium]|nr:hypothetical protein [Anaerolineales bacterium]
MPEVELPNPEELEERRGKAFTRRVALTTSRSTFIFSLLLAVIGVLLTLNGYTLIFKLPFLYGSH